MATGIDPLLQKLRVRLLAPLYRQISSFWSWWSGQLIPLLPVAIREAIASSSTRVLIEIDHSDIVFLEGSGSALRTLGRYSSVDTESVSVKLPEQISEFVLRLPADKVLTRSLTLPLAAEENLREVLGFEMDRQTPFSADQVYYDYYVSERTSAQESLTVELVVSPKTVVDEFLSKLVQYDISPHVITTLADDAKSNRPVNLLPDSLRRRSAFGTPRLNTTLAATCAALLIIALLLPIGLNQQKVQQLEVEQQSIQGVASDALELQREVERLAAASQFLSQKKQSTVLVLQMLEEVSRILPDNTWLSRFDVNGPEVQLQGQSSSAAALIQLLESSPMFQNARFRSPVVQVPRTEVERFHLSVDLEKLEST